MSTHFGGYMGKVLRVDLTTREVRDYPWTDSDRELFLGGKIMAARILSDHIQGPTDPYSEQNLLVFTTGPLTGSGAPSSARWNVSTISPMTGYIASSNCGGNFGFHLKRAGYDGLVVAGKADQPVWLDITDEKVEFRDAGFLWGKTTSETQELLGKQGGKAVIGPAGENMVRYASIFSQERAAGRGGMGAVMGSKKLKAVTASGKQPIHFADREKNAEANKKWIALLRNHPITGKILPELGTANLLRRMQRHNILATRNFGQGSWSDYDLVSGERMAEYHLIKNTGCLGCPIRCGRVVEVGGKNVKGPELETLGLLGPNLLNNDLNKICEWNYLLDELGMDTMSFGGTLAFAMELQEKCLWNCGLEFGKVDQIPQIIEDTAYRRGIGALLAEGSKRLAEKFGGHAFAMNVKGLELAAYEPRGAAGQGLGYAVANRGGCHLNSGYMVFMEGLGLAMNGTTRRSKAALAIMMQNLMEGVSAAGTCLFTTYAMIPGFLLDDRKSVLSHSTNVILGLSGPAVQVLNVFQGWMAPFHNPLLPHTRALETLTGMKMSFGRLLSTGERGFNLERLLNIRLGLTGQEDTLPARLTKESQQPGKEYTRVPIRELKKDFYRKRGWDKNGIPKLKTLKRLSLA